jgi:hypothetical protein
MVKNIAVVGLDDFNGRYLFEDLLDDEDIRFHAALDREEITLTDSSYPFEERLSLARRRMEEIPGGVDGVITYWDFPASAFTPFLARDFGLPYATPESVTKCEHKLWSREEQAKVVDTPGFSAFHPFGQDPLGEISLNFPFWVKPVVGHSSMLGFEIASKADFAAALEEIRADIRELTRPFRFMIENVDLPQHLAEQGASLCIAEEIISQGDQYTLEGYVRGGEVTVYGVVDSIRLENEHTFSRYQYPSRLDRSVVQRMEDMTKRIMRQFGYDRSPFNIEFFYDPESGRISVLEINSRLSQSHSDLFKKVDGQPHQQIAVDLALDRKPRWRQRQGAFDVAAKFFLRRFEDARVRRIPDEQALKRLSREMPDVRVAVKVEPGQRLSSLGEQESYSYEIADLFIGGRDEKELCDKYDACREILQFDFELA